MINPTLRESNYGKKIQYKFRYLVQIRLPKDME
jgi:hypothetical protein